MREKPGLKLEKVMWGVLIWMLLGVSIAVAENVSEPSKNHKASVTVDTMHQLIIQSIVEYQLDDGIDALSGFLFDEIKQKKKSIKKMSAASEGIILLRMFKQYAAQSSVEPEFFYWLFSSMQRVSLFNDTFSDKDDWTNVFSLLYTLYKHDVKGRDAYFNLILALAVVWDQPRPPIHGQMGPEPLHFETNITRRYDYYKKLYGPKGKAKQNYDELSVDTLILVVDAPVPISELKWCYRYVKGGLKSWDRKYSEITYDKNRLDSGQYSWTYGPYTLDSIKDKGGICIDQAYYGAITAKAYGIPAILFSGMGKRGPHAWFAYRQREGKWKMDIGRYTTDKYATGKAVNPQTNERMTDHQVNFYCDKSFQTKAHKKALKYTRIAQVLYATNQKKYANYFAKKATTLSPLHIAAWNMRKQLLRETNNMEKLLEVISLQMKYFKKYPYILTELAKEKADILRHLGRSEEATRILKTTSSRVKKKRDDLSTELTLEQIYQEFLSGDKEDARKSLEKLIRKRKKEGEKMFKLLGLYLALTKKTDQTKKATFFLKKFIKKVPPTGDDDADKKIQMALQEFLAVAYENDGREKKAAKIRKRASTMR